MTELTIDTIKHAIMQGRKTRLREDMKGPVDLYDGVAVAARARSIPADITADRCAELISEDGTNVAFFGPVLSVPILDENGNHIASGLKIRYAAW